MASGASSDVEGFQSLGWDYSCDFEVDYKSQDHAAIVFAALDVDKELQPDKVKRQISVFDGKLKVDVFNRNAGVNPSPPNWFARLRCDDCMLEITTAAVKDLINALLTSISLFLHFRRFEAVEARFLRATFSAFVDLLILATKIIEEYDHNFIKS